MAGPRFTKRKDLYFIAEYTDIQTTAHSATLQSGPWFLELWYAYHYRYTNNYLLVSDLNKEYKYKGDEI
jgi:hypothetical protein